MLQHLMVTNVFTFIIIITITVWELPCGSAVKNSTSTHEDAGWIPVPPQRLKDQAAYAADSARSGVAVAVA